MQNDQAKLDGPKKPLGVYAIIERKDKDKPSHWLKLGAAFTNRDGSLTLLMDAFPTGATRLQIREQKTWDERQPERTHAYAAEVES